MTTYIYTLADPRTNQIRYVGKTLCLSVRLQGHIAQAIAKGQRTRAYFWKKALKRAGLKPVMEVLEAIESDTDCEWQEAERFWIRYLRFLGFNLCNHDEGGNSGFRKSAETKRKISVACKGRRLSPESIEKMKATKRANLTPEVRARYSASARGRKHKPETIALMKAQRKGHPTSEETRRKISEKHKGMKVSAETKEKLSRIAIAQGLGRTIMSSRNTRRTPELVG